MKLCLVGESIGTFGIKGELKIKSFTDFSNLRFQKGNKLIFETTNSEQTILTISTVRFHAGNYLISFEGLENINLIEPYAHAKIYIESTKRQQLTEGSYYPDEIIDFEVYYRDKLLGKIAEIEFTKAHPLIKVINENNTHLIPFVPAYIKKVDLSNKKIEINPDEDIL